MADELLTERVLRAVETLPSGAVVTYGEVAELVGTGPRQVGRVMAEYGSSVPWWRVVNAAGCLPEHLVAEARRHWLEEGLETTQRGVRISRPDPALWRDAWLAAVGDL
ncbi:MGMT family protein [Acidipropionibacterium timonense]|uniref:MGMT family protein n=1 Tax=Acidipropionibacterium timonense TaxID=2161818 RepID=UPI001031CDB6|nr:MGMT family protein [Acidipropionibacterium timonense]